ncbi:outer membrane protein assembly factor BamB family protein [Halococcoides cellulosivorans]|nr:PQQ-binding-like beta-propeller repeat protein [Halococcoides cellulosivorans]
MPISDHIVTDLLGDSVENSISRRNFVKAVGASGVALGGAGVTLANEDGVKMRDTSNAWGVRRDAHMSTGGSENEEHDDIWDAGIWENTHMISSTSLNLVGRTWEPRGNPDMSAPADGAWRYTFAISSSAIAYGELEEDMSKNWAFPLNSDPQDPFDTAYMGREVQFRETFTVESTGTDDQIDRIAIAERRDKDYCGFIHGRSFFEELYNGTEVEAPYVPPQFIPSQLGEGLSSRYANPAGVLNDAEVKYEQEQAQDRIQDAKAGVGVAGSTIGLAITIAGVSLPLVGLGVGIVGLTLSIDGFFNALLEEPDRDVAIYRGFRHQRPSEACGPAGLGYVTFDVFVSPDETTQFTTTIDISQNGHQFVGDDPYIHPEWTVEIDAGPPENDRPTRETLDINWGDSSPADPPDEANEDKQYGSSPTPVIGYPNQISESDTVRFDAYGTKLEMHPLADTEPYEWTLSRSDEKVDEYCTRTDSPYLDVDFESIDNATGIYEMTLSVTDASGGTGTAVDDTIRVGDSDEVGAVLWEATREQTPDGAAVTFNIGKYSSGDVDEWTLSYDGPDGSHGEVTGSTLREIMVVHQSEIGETHTLTFDQTGTYDVTLEVVPVDGQVSTASVTVEIESSDLEAPAPGAALDVAETNTIENGTQVTFSYGKRESVDIDEWVLNFGTWVGPNTNRFQEMTGEHIQTFGTPPSDVGETSTVLYRTTGEYEVTLTVTGKNGKESTATTTVQIGDEDEGNGGTERVRWTYELESSKLAAAPTVEDGPVYTATSGGTVHAVDPETGDAMDVPSGSWSTQAASTPIPAGEDLLVRSWGGKLYSADAMSGTVNWTFTGQAGGLASRPTYHGGTAYAVLWNGSLVAIDASTGEVQWRLNESATTFADPPVVNDGTVFVRSRAGTLWAVSADGGDIRWRNDSIADGVAVQPAVHNDSIYVVSFDGRLHDVTADDGTVVDSFSPPSTGPYSSSPVVGEEHAYVASGGGTVHAVDRTTGNVDWSFSKPHGGVRGLTVRANTLLVVSDEGTLYAVDI